MIFGVLDTETVAQLTLNGVFRGAAYGILGVGFALILFSYTFVNLYFSAEHAFR